MMIADYDIKWPTEPDLKKKIKKKLEGGWRLKGYEMNSNVCIC